MENDNLFIKMLTNQVHYLENQNKELMQQNKELTEKIFSLLNENKNNVLIEQKPKIFFYENLTVCESWSYFVENIKNSVTFEDIKFYEKGYTDCIFDIILRLFNTIDGNRPLYTFSKKNKIMVIYRENKWSRIAFDDFKNEIKIIANKIVHALFCNFKKKIPHSIYDETIAIMMSDTDKYKDHIANRLVEYCIYLG